MRFAVVVSVVAMSVLSSGWAVADPGQVAATQHVGDRPDGSPRICFTCW